MARRGIRAVAKEMGGRAAEPGWRTALLAVALVVCAESTAALDPLRPLPQLAVQNWRTDQGLPQNSVNAIARTREGFLWVGTQEGLARFDGTGFTVYNHANTPALRSSAVNALCALPDGSLWIGTDAGLARLASGRFEEPVPALQGVTVTDVRRGPGGEVWVAALNGLTCLRDGKTQSFTSASAGLPADPLFVLCPCADGSLWTSASGGAVACVRDGKVTLTMRLAGESLIPMAQDAQGRLWAGTHKGIRLLREGRFEPWGPPGLAGEHITALVADREGCVWAGTRSGDLYRLRGGEAQFLHRPEGFPEAKIGAFQEDVDGNLWVGTSGNGLFRLRGSAILRLPEVEGLYVSSVQASRGGGLWAATSGGGLIHLSDEGGRVPRKVEGLDSDTVLVVLEARDGTLWIGTATGGLFRAKGGVARRVEPGPDFGRPLVTTILEDRQGALWVGTAGQGLYRITSGGLVHFGPVEGLSNGTVHVLFEDSSGRVWAGTEGGLGLYEGGRFTVFTPEDARFSAILALYEDQEGLLWVGTLDGGLNLFRDRAFTPVTSLQGLHSDTILQILPDDLGNLWMSSHRGLFRVARKDLVDCAAERCPRVPCVAYGVAEGMKSADCSGGFTGSGTRLKDGRLCFPTWRGVAIVNPAEASLAHPPPPVFVESLVCGGRALPNASNLDLPKGLRSVEIHYTGIDLAAPESIHFQYRLEGIDEDWIDAGLRRVATYANLRPGRYHFRVRAASGAGAWSETPAEVRMTVPPRYYETPWFYFLAILTCVAAAAWLYHLRFRAMNARQRVLEREVGRRTRDLRDAFEALEGKTRELERLNKILERTSSEDSLTGLANRRCFEARLELEWRRAERSDSPLSLVILDVDFFKHFNDAYGHHEGDHCLQRVAEVMATSCARATDVCARLGGDEFCVLMAETDFEEARATAERLRAGVEALAIPHSSSPVSRSVTVSVGVSSAIPQDDLTTDHLFDTSDQALYRAKEAGRNRVFGTPFERKPRRSEGAPGEP